MADWIIDPSKNEGYPSLTVWAPEWETGWTSNDNIRYPDYMWRIKAGVNDDYPWLYPWFKAESTDGGDMEIGGAQTNYPNGFSYFDTGGVSDQFNDDDMGFDSGALEAANSILAAALSEKALALSSSEFKAITNRLNNPNAADERNAGIIQQMYGANIYDGILLCRMYPFSVFNAQSSTQVHPAIFGKYPLYEVNQEGDPVNAYYTAPFLVRFFDMGSLDINILQAWEVEGISYYLYLPYAGTHPLDVRDGSTVNVCLTIDLLTGVGEYTVKQNGQVTGLYKIQTGIDVPINLSQGQMAANYAGFVTNAISKGIGAAAGTAGAVNPALGVAGGVAADMMSMTAGHFDVSSPAVGGNASVTCYPYARIIAKIPKMFNGGYGYKETQGVNRSTTYERLENCTGFVRCINYKTDIITATQEEKDEIERLMNEGVFL